MDVLVGDEEKRVSNLCESTREHPDNVLAYEQLSHELHSHQRFFRSMFLLEQDVGSIERDHVVRQWKTLRKKICVWMFNHANGIAVGKIRYNRRGEMESDALSVQERADELGISVPGGVIGNPY